MNCFPSLFTLLFFKLIGWHYLPIIFNSLFMHLYFDSFLAEDDRPISPNCVVPNSSLGDCVGVDLSEDPKSSPDGSTDGLE